MEFYYPSMDAIVTKNHVRIHVPLRQELCTHFTSLLFFHLLPAQVYTWIASQGSYLSFMRYVSGICMCGLLLIVSGTRNTWVSVNSSDTRVHSHSPGVSSTASGFSFIVGIKYVSLRLQWLKAKQYENNSKVVMFGQNLSIRIPVHSDTC